MLSIEDSFIVGVTFDVLGGYYLARGLLAKPRDLWRRASGKFGGNPDSVTSAIEAGADARLGLGFLVVGFALQAAGYIAEVAGVTLTTGLARTLVAVALAAVLATAGFKAARIVRRSVLRRLAIGVSRVDSTTGELVTLPDRLVLERFAQTLGFSTAGIETRDDAQWGSA